MTRKVVVALCLVVVAALSLWFGEIERLVGEVGRGTGFSIADVTGLNGFGSAWQWSAWQTFPGSTHELPTPAPFIWIHLALDLIYIATYAVIASISIDAGFPSRGGGVEEKRALFRRRLPARIALAALVVVDLVEDSFLLNMSVTINAHEVPSAEIIQLQAGISVAKWVAVLLVLSLVLRAPRIWIRMWLTVRRVAEALYAQRLSAILVLILATLSLLAFDPLLEQVPDIQRSWLDDGNARYGGAAALILTVIAVTFWTLGRARAQLYQRIYVDGVGSHRVPRDYGRRSDPDDRDVRLRRLPGWNYAIWAGIPILVSLFALNAANQPQDLFDPGPYGWFVGVFTLLLVGSAVAEFVLWLGRRNAEEGPFISTARADGTGLVDRVAFTGDILAALVIALPALGLARSLSTQLILGATIAPGDYTSSDLQPSPDLIVTSAVVTLASVLIACGVITLAVIRVDAHGAPGTFAPDAPRTLIDQPTAQAVTICAGVFFSGFLLWLALKPSEAGERLGGVAVAIGALGAWISLIGIFALVLRQRRPLALTEALGLRSDPIITLFLIVPIIVVQFAGSQGIHAVDQRSIALPDRVNLRTAFGDWLDRNEGCWAEVQTNEGTQSIRPLMLVAAEGGGIRAAAWTVGTLAEVVEAGSCAGNSIFLSSGVSGGAIGLAMAANPSYDPDEITAGPSAFDAASSMRDEVGYIASSPALASAISGFVIGDPVAATTGLRMPSLESHDHWRDRASLIENAWRDNSYGLSADFDADAAMPTGLVVLGSTDVRSGCRVVVSQVELGAGQSGSTLAGTPGNCSVGGEEPPLTLDLFDYLESCDGESMDWATAGLLSARFPLVTPSGTIGGRDGGCDGMPRMQLVDGGYAEVTGLGILADSAPTLATIIRNYNTLGRDEGEPLVVPYVMYIQNSAVPVYDPPSTTDTPELIVPILGTGTGATQVAPASWIQRIMYTYGPLCNTAVLGGDEGANAAAIRRCNSEWTALTPATTTTRRTVIMSMDVSPSLTLPLGWGLSKASLTQIMGAARYQAGSGSCRPFELTRMLGDYLDLFESHPDPGVDVEPVENCATISPGVE